MYAPLTPETILFNRYRVVGLSGQGALGLTYLAHDQKRFDELCLIQEFVPAQRHSTVVEALRQRFHHEAAILYELQHSQVPRFHIMFAQGDRLYLARNYIVGKSYAALIGDRQTAGTVFSQAEVLRLVMQTLPALTYLHQLGLVHQNISPASLVLRRQDPLPVLIDFGMVRQWVFRLQLHPVAPEIALAQPGYAAPEQESGQITPSTDLYALAATAVTLLTRQAPPELYNRWTRSLDWENHAVVQPEFAAVLKQMLHPNPQKRLGSAMQVLQKLEAIAPLIVQGERSLRAVTVPVPLAAMPNSLAAPRPIDAPSAASLADRQPLHPRRSPRSPQAPNPSPRSPGDWRASAVLVLSVALLVSVISLRALSWVQKDASQESSSSAPAIANSTQPSLKTANSSPAASATPAIPTREPTREVTPAASPPAASEISMETLRDRRRQLGIDFQFMLDLVDEQFYAKHPDIQGQKLGEQGNQTELRQEWNAIANDTLSQLATLSTSPRSKLGRYQRADYDRWLKPGNGASLNQQELNVLVNNRFGQLFPAQKGKTLSPKTFGQVWYAIADEEMSKLKPQQ